MKKIIFSYFLIISILGLVFLEFALLIYSKINKINIINDNEFQKLISVWEEGKLFNPREIFFTYEKNITNRRFLKYYYDKNKLTKIWDYKFSTNNFGLVQKNNIFEEKESILFLGDSGTEGIGSEPWVDKFGGSINNLQLINGGLRGTGFQQFHNLEKFMSSKFNIRYVIVIYIGLNVRRDIISHRDTNCIRNFNLCGPNNRDFGVPKNKYFDIEKNLEDVLKKKNTNLDLKTKLKFFIRDTYIYTYLRTPINRIRFINDTVIKNNLQSILDLKKKYQDKIFFIRVNTAPEITMKLELEETILISNFMEKNKIKNYFCDMKYDIKMFHEFDLHPNENGYKNLYNCVREIIKKNLINEI